MSVVVVGAATLRRRHQCCWHCAAAKRPSLGVDARTRFSGRSCRTNLGECRRTGRAALHGVPRPALGLLNIDRTFAPPSQPGTFDAPRANIRMYGGMATRRTSDGGQLCGGGDAELCALCRTVSARRGGAPCRLRVLPVVIRHAPLFVRLMDDPQTRDRRRPTSGKTAGARDAEAARARRSGLRPRLPA